MEAVHGVPACPLEARRVSAPVLFLTGKSSLLVTPFSFSTHTRGEETDSAVMKGKILEKVNRISESIIQYEQIAKSDNQIMSVKALFRLTKLNLRQQDFYEAYFNIKRIKNNLIKKINLYRTLIEGMIALMKNKEGLNYLSSIKDDIKNLKSDIQYMYYNFMAYGYMTKHQFKVRKCKSIGSYSTI